MSCAPILPIVRLHLKKKINCIFSLLWDTRKKDVHLRSSFLGANGHSKKPYSTPLPIVGVACGDERYGIKSSWLSCSSVHTRSSELICSGVQNTTAVELGWYKNNCGA